MCVYRDLLYFMGVCIWVQYLGRTEESIRSQGAGVTGCEREPFSIGSGDWTQALWKNSKSLNHWAIRPDPIHAHSVCSTKHSHTDILFSSPICPPSISFYSLETFLFSWCLYIHNCMYLQKIMDWLVGSAPGLGDLSLVLKPTRWKVTHFSFLHAHVLVCVHTHALTLCPHSCI